MTKKNRKKKYRNFNIFQTKKMFPKFFHLSIIAIASQLLVNYFIRADDEFKYFESDPSLQEMMPQIEMDKFLEDFHATYYNRNQICGGTTNLINTEPNSKPKKEITRLSEILARGIMNNVENLALIQNEKFRKMMRMPIVVYDPTNGRFNSESGDKRCDFMDNGTSMICPWHYELRVREDMFPRMRMNAICNCKYGCLAKTEVEEHLQIHVNYCRPVFSYMPVLVKEKSGEWMFAIEEVPTACACSINLEVAHG
jgi:hypothetical protein